MSSVLRQLLELVGKNIDNAMLLLDQAKLLQALDALVTLTDHIHGEAQKGDQSSLPKDLEEQNKGTFAHDRL